MSKKIKTSIIAFNGKFLECESLLELRSGTTEEEWFGICKSTIEMYCYMRVAKELGGPTIGNKKEQFISKHDARIFKRLGESIETLKKLDPDNLGTFDLDTLSKDHVAVIEKEWQGVQQTMKIAHGQSVINADIQVSGI